MILFAMLICTHLTGHCLEGDYGTPGDKSYPAQCYAWCDGEWKEMPKAQSQSWDFSSELAVPYQAYLHITPPPYIGKSLSPTCTIEDRKSVV